MLTRPSMTPGIPRIAWLTALFFACLWAAAVTFMNVNRSDMLRPLALTRFDDIEVAGLARFGDASGPTISEGANFSIDVTANRMYLDNGETSTRLQFQSSGGTNYIQSGINGTSNSAAPLRIGSMLDGTNWLTFDALGNSTFRLPATFASNITAGPTNTLDGDFNFYGTVNGGQFTGTTIAGGKYNFVATDYSDQALGTGGSYKMDGPYTDSGTIIGAAEMKASKSNGISGDVGHDLILATKTSGDTGFDARLIIDQTGMQVLNSAGVMAKIFAGNNTPEGSITAPVGSVYMRANGAAGTTLYSKATGVGNTGWAALASAPAAGSISISTAATAAAVNLSTLGTIDWMYSSAAGTNPASVSNNNHKRSGGFIRTSFRWGALGSILSQASATTWTATASDNIIPNATISLTTCHGFFNNGGGTSQGTNFAFYVPAVAATRYLRVYFTWFDSNVRITASLPDGTTQTATSGQGSGESYFLVQYSGTGDLSVVVENFTSGANTHLKFCAASLGSA